MIDRTTDLLKRVAEFLKGLSNEDIDSLAAGESQLKLVPKGARITTGAAAKKAVALAVDAQRINADLRALNDRLAAKRYVEDLGLSADGLKELAKQLDVPVASKDAKSAIVNKIVDQKVGHRLNSDAIYARR